jgi:glutamyl-tRNA synthetase
VPEFAHLPMILGPDGQKLSKRHGAVSVMQYRDDGFLPHALLNYLVRLGWSHGDQEIFSREEMIALFDIADVNTSAARFDLEKLSWLNQQYLKNDDPLEITPAFEWQLRASGIDPARGPDPVDVVVALRERAHTLKEMAERHASGMRRWRHTTKPRSRSTCARRRRAPRWRPRTRTWPGWPIGRWKTCTRRSKPPQRRSGRAWARWRSRCASR